MPATSPFLSSVATSNIYWVESETQARNYPIAYNASVILLDGNQDLMYIKSVDSAGVMTAFRKFDIHEIVEFSGSGVSQEDFDALKNELLALKEQLNKRPVNNYRKNNRRGRYEDGE